MSTKVENFYTESYQTLKILSTSTLGGIVSICVCNPFDVCRNSYIYDKYKYQNRL